MDSKYPGLVAIIGLSVIFNIFLVIVAVEFGKGFDDLREAVYEVREGVDERERVDIKQNKEITDIENRLLKLEG